MTGLMLLSIAVGFVGSVLCATAGRVIGEIAWHELEERCQRERAIDLFSEIYESREPMLVGADVFQQLFNMLLACIPVFWWLSIRSVSNINGSQLISLFLLIGLALILANSWIPWAVARTTPVGYLFRTWRWWKLAAVLAWPLTIPGAFFTILLARISGQPEVEENEEEAFEDEILSIVSEAEQDGYIESEAREMIEGVMELSDTNVSSVMTPRSKVDALPATASWDETLAQVVESGRTRIPIYRDSIDHVIGILYAKDLLRESMRPESKRRPLSKLLRRPIFVPEQTRLDEMLNQFLHCRTHMAIVQDEYGGIAGVITIEDVLEEIVGEIVDETDKEKTKEITILNDHQADVQGSVHIYQLNEALGLQLPDEETFDTISGLIMNHLKEVPRPGHEVVIGSVKFNIQDATRRVINAVRVTKLDDDEQ
jgi:CBS domain containing-hemolysin-like protein